MRPSRITSIAAVALLASALLAPPAAAAPTCGGERATKEGTRGPDVLKGTPGNDVIVGGGGDDQIAGKGGADIVCGGAGGDLIIGGGGNDRLLGGGGDDGISGGGGNDRIAAGTGSDFVSFLFSRQGVRASLATGTATGEGSDSFAGAESMFGSLFDDTLIGDAGPNIITGDTGNDAIDGGGHIDLIAGEGGDDAIDGGTDPDWDWDMAIYWTSSVGVEVDVAAGTTRALGPTDETDNDTISDIEAIGGSEYDDVMRGDTGSNFFFGEGGDDTLDGREGFDVALYWQSPAPVSADLSSGVATGQGTDALSAIEGLGGSRFADVLRGNQETNWIDADAGDDQLFGGAQDDWLQPGPGNDAVDGGEGTFDAVSFFNAPMEMTVSLTAGTASGEGSDTIAGIEGVEGSGFDDSLTGDAGPNILVGLAGDDSLFGLAGDDGLGGGEGTDVGDGGDGIDRCFAIEDELLCENEAETPEHPLDDEAADLTTFKKTH